MGEQSDFMITVTVEIIFGGLGEHKPLIFDFFFLLYITRVGGCLGRSKEVIGNPEHPEISTWSASGNGGIQYSFRCKIV